MDGLLCILLLQKGHREVVELLLAKGADIKAVDNNGYTPLHWAAQKGHREAVELLLSKGADMKAGTYSGWMPLHLAAYNAHERL